jgi:hypothetical protein
MLIRILIGILLASASAFGSLAEIDQMFREMLSPGGPIPTDREFFSKVGDGVNALTMQEVKQLLPLAQKALYDSRPQVIDRGLQFLLVVSIRPAMDGAELLTPCIPDLEAIMAGKEHARKRVAMGVIAYMRPRIPDELLKFLSNQLENKENSEEETGHEAAALVESRNPTFVKRAISFVEDGNRPVVMGMVVQCLGLSQNSSPESLSVIGSGLDSKDSGVRWYAVDAASRLPQTIRSRFLARLNQIALDPNEGKQLREHASQATKN